MSGSTIHNLSTIRFEKDVMPLLFVGHGSPMNAIEDNEFSQNWRSLGQVLPEPQAILCVSAHWLTQGTAITGAERPETIHDFYGFPRQLYEIEYPAPGHPELAETISAAITCTTVTLDARRGLDHGTWVVLKHMYGRAGVPVLQLSIDASQPPSFHYELGQQLAPLRKRGILIIGSGNIVHNLGEMSPDATPYDWAEAFDRRIAELLLKGDHQDIIDYETCGQIARLSVPTNDHYLPLLYAIGAQQDDQIAFFSERIVFGSVSMRCVLFS